MDADDLAATIDHCALGPTTTPADVRRIVDEVEEYGMNAACLPRCFVQTAVEYKPNVPVLGGIGGSTSTTESKREDAIRAYTDGATEIDMTINVPRLKAGHTRIVERDIAAVADAVPIPVKAIIEVPLLEDGEIRTACQLAREAGADYVKNTTGFVGGETRAEDIAVMAEYMPVKVSAVSTWEQVEEMLEAGAERIGTGHGPEIVDGFKAAQEAQ